MKKSFWSSLLLVLAICFFMACGQGDAVETPEDVVNGYFIAHKALDYNKAVSYLDVDHIIAEKGMGHSVEAMRSEIVEVWKENPTPADLNYRVVSSNQSGDSAVVVVEMSAGGEGGKVEIPLGKVQGVWKIKSFN